MQKYLQNKYIYRLFRLRRTIVLGVLLLVAGLELWYWIARPSADLGIAGQIIIVLFSAAVVGGLNILFPRSWLRLLGAAAASSVALLILAVVSRLMGRDPASIWNAMSFTSIVIFVVLAFVILIGLAALRKRRIDAPAARPFKTRKRVWIDAQPEDAFEAIHIENTEDPLDRSLRRIDFDDLTPNRYFVVMKNPYSKDDTPDDGYGYTVDITDSVPGQSETRTIFTTDADEPVEVNSITFKAKKGGTQMRVQTVMHNVSRLQRWEMWLSDSVADTYHYMKEYAEGVKDPVSIKAIPFH